jgi:hypothetical protein
MSEEKGPERRSAAGVKGRQLEGCVEVNSRLAEKHQPAKKE